MTEAARKRNKYATDPDFRERRKAASKAYYARVKDTPEFKAKNLARITLWRKENPDKVKAQAKSERAKEYRRARYAAGLDKYANKPRTQEQRDRRNFRQREIRRLGRLILQGKPVDLPVEEANRILAMYTKMLENGRRNYSNHKEELNRRYKEKRDANIEFYRARSREYYRRSVRRKLGLKVI